jgi:4-hydroxybenzoate polyprenyltransferase
LPAGRVSAGHVWLGGFGLLAGGVLLVSMHNPSAGVFAFALAGAILLYDAWHKTNPFAPIVMGLCRALVYVTTAAAVGAVLGMKIAAAALALGAYVAGLTYIAREENLDRLSSWWPIPLLLAAPLTAFAFQPSLLMAAATVAFLAVMTYALKLLVRRQAGDVKSAVSLLIAAIALVDALFILAAGQPVAAGLCAAAFLLTLYFQRFVPGT